MARNKTTGTSDGYAYVEFATQETADGVLRGYNGHPIPNTEHSFRLSWATASGRPSGGDGETCHPKLSDKTACGEQCYPPDLVLLHCWQLTGPGMLSGSATPQQGVQSIQLDAAGGPDHSIFCGDLAPDVSDYVLTEKFRQYFPSVRSAKVSLLVGLKMNQSPHPFFFAWDLTGVLWSCPECHACQAAQVSVSAAMLLL